MKMQEIAAKDRPYSERFRLAGRRWAEAKRKADVLDELKSARLEKLKTDKLRELIAAGEKSVPEAKLERLVKGSPEWEEYLTGLCFAREQENQAWVERKAIEMEATENLDRNANNRSERRL